MQRILKQETRTQRKLFFWAARYGYVELVRSNLKQCPSLINRRNKWGIPALCKAAKKGHTDIVELLLAHPDANVNIETDLHTTALCMVADKGNVEMAKLLIAHGAGSYLPLSLSSLFSLLSSLFSLIYTDLFIFIYRCEYSR